MSGIEFMTEEDTFKALKRISFMEMEKLLDQWVEDTSDRRTVPEVLEDNDWTINEYDDAAERRGRLRATNGDLQ